MSPVGIVTGYGLDGRGSVPGRGKRFFVSSVPFLLRPTAEFEDDYEGRILVRQWKQSFAVLMYCQSMVSGRIVENHTQKSRISGP
jgi:hypothetical protein